MADQLPQGLLPGQEDPLAPGLALAVGVGRCALGRARAAGHEPVRMHIRSSGSRASLAASAPGLTHTCPPRLSRAGGCFESRSRKICDTARCFLAHVARVRNVPLPRREKRSEPAALPQPRFSQIEMRRGESERDSRAQREEQKKEGTHTRALRGAQWYFSVGDCTSTKQFTQGRSSCMRAARAAAAPLSLSHFPSHQLLAASRPICSAGEFF